MARMLGVLAVTGFAFVLRAAASAATGPLDDPPPNLSPVTVHVADVLRANAAATGRLDPSAHDTTVEDWTLTINTERITEHLERVGSDYLCRVADGPFTNAYGSFAGVRWHRDDNGYTTRTSSDADESTFLPLGTFSDLVDPKNDLTLAGATGGDDPQYVIKLNAPQQKDPQWVFVDEKTALITRVENIAHGHRVIHTYDDYRLSDGLREPWHIHDADPTRKLESDWVRTSMTHPASIDPSHFVPPPSAPTVAYGFAQASALPARTSLGSFVVRLSVQGRGLDFLIDTGSRESIIDRDVAQQLHLQSFGELTSLPDGSPLGYTTMLEDATVGPVRLHDFALDVRTYNYNFSNDVKVVGVLGYDFLAGVVLHLDYVNGTAELIPREKFSGAMPSRAASAFR